MRGLVIAMALGLGAAPMTAEDIHKLPAVPPTLVEQYGPGPMQFGELRLPAGKGPFPVAIIIHGGCFTRSVESAKGTGPIATALAEKGVATWNIEYRALGDAGAGYPGTFQDFGAGADHVLQLATRYPLDLTRVIAVGHEAGASAAVFLATRFRLPRASDLRGPEPIKLRGVVAIDGSPDVTRFAGADAAMCGRPVVRDLLGGTEAEQPIRYREVSPSAWLPLGTRTYLISSSQGLPLGSAEGFRDEAAAAGGAVEVFPVMGDRFNVIAPGQPQWTEVETVIMKALGK